MRNRYAIGAAFALALASCSVSSIVSLIGAALTIAEEAAAITGVLPPEYVAYVSAAGDCIAFAAEEESSADSAAVKAAKIGAQCAHLASVTLPPGTAANVSRIAYELAFAIHNILAELPKVKKPLTAADVEMLRAIPERARAAGAKVQTSYGFRSRKN
jgi:hypothetical protein